MNSKKDTFLKMLEQHKALIHKVSYSYCKQSEDRKDLTQEIIIQLWASFETYDPQYQYSTWIYRIALNTAISYYRKHQNRRERIETTAPIFEIKTTSEEIENDNPDLEILHSLIEKLADIDRALFLLYLDGVSQNQISDIMGISTSNVSTKINRRKKKLKTQFSNLKAK